MPYGRQYRRDIGGSLQNEERGRAHEQPPRRRPYPALLLWGKKKDYSLVIFTMDYKLNYKRGCLLDTQGVVFLGERAEELLARDHICNFYQG